MDFYEVLEKVIDLLQREQRVSYRALKIQFALTDDHLEALKDELIKAKKMAVDEDGAVLVWTGEAASASPPAAVPAQEPQPPPVTYTPTHLAEKIRQATETLEGERKQVTVMFADIKGSMALLEGLDPEDARRLIDPALQLMMDAVHRYEGFVAQTMGDGIFALFGAPIAHEDHPQRALYAALRMQENLAQYSDAVRLQHGIPMLIRVGINTGDVVVRSIRKDDLHTDYVPVGHSTGLAARMEGLAAPGTVVVSEHTHKRTEGYFQFRDLGQARVKGVREPVSIYEVLGVGPLRTRLQVAAWRGLVRFVGRQRELEQMQQALALGTEGHGQIVAVMGEAGVGKSRLVYEFKLGVPEPWMVLETFSVSHGKAYAYLPLIELLKAYFQLTPENDERTRREKIGGKVLMLDRRLEDALPYLFTLLGIAETESSLQSMDPQIRRRRTLEAIKRLLVRESLNQPVLLVFEDLHWLDSETQAFLDLLSEGLATARLLLLVNYRPEYRHEWGSKTYYSHLRLDPLGPAEADELLTALLGSGQELQPLKQLILDRTAGNPFFIEEMVQALFEQGVLVRDGGVTVTRPVTDIQVPPTVQGILAARIDRLAAADKALLQTLAVIGKTFSLPLMRHIVELSDEALYQGLAHLQAAEFLYEQPAFPEPDYTFKHALTQEVAYHSLLTERRRELHERTAQAIEALYGDRLEEHVETLAHHYQHSGNAEQAVTYLQRAGRQAAQRAAYEDAIAHLTTAVELLGTLPDTPERMQRELTLQIALGTPLMVARGYSVPEVEQAFQRARELCQHLGESPQLASVLQRGWTMYLNRGELDTARELSEQLLDLARERHDPRLRMMATGMHGITLYHQGVFAQARESLEQALDLYDPQRDRSRRGLQDPKATDLAHLALTLWVLGYPEQALQKDQEALTLVRELAHPNTLAATLWYSGRLHMLMRDTPTVHERAEAAVTLSTEHGLALMLVMATLNLGWALVMQDRDSEGIAQLQQGIESLQAQGHRNSQPFTLTFLAEAYGHMGQFDNALDTMSEAFAVMAEIGGRQDEAEMYRLKGELIEIADCGLRIGRRKRVSKRRWRWHATNKPNRWSYGRR